jgi:hypothetical protein
MKDCVAGKNLEDFKRYINKTKEILFKIFSYYKKEKHLLGRKIIMISTNKNRTDIESKSTRVAPVDSDRFLLSNAMAAVFSLAVHLGVKIHVMYNDCVSSYKVQPLASSSCRK